MPKVYCRGGKNRNLNSTCGWSTNGTPREVEGKFKIHCKVCSLCSKCKLNEFDESAGLMNGMHGMRGSSKVIERKVNIISSKDNNVVPIVVNSTTAEQACVQAIKSIST
jgi:hypothetical protein